MPDALYHAARRLAALVLSFAMTLGIVLALGARRAAEAPSRVLDIGSLLLVALALLANHRARRAIERASMAASAVPPAHGVYRANAREREVDAEMAVYAATRNGALALCLLSLAMTLVVVAAVMR